MDPADPLNLKAIIEGLILDQKLTLTPREVCAIIQVVNAAQAALEALPKPSLE
jgi:hypothetical protein